MVNGCGWLISAAGFLSISMTVWLYRQHGRSRHMAVSLAEREAEHLALLAEVARLQAQLTTEAAQYDQLATQNSALLRTNQRLEQELVVRTDVGSVAPHAGTAGQKTENTCRLHSLMFPADPGKTGWIEATQKIDHLLTAQLEGAIQDTAVAAGQIFEKSTTLSSAMDSLNRFLAESREQSALFGGNSRQVAQQDQAAIHAFQEFLANQEAARQQEAAAVRHAINEVHKLNLLVAKVLDLSDRTKVLAINAGIVAARAGVHGKQFNVVAQEVRSMAEQTAQVARDIEQGIVQSAKQVETALLQRFNENATREQDTLMANATNQMDRLGRHFADLLAFTNATMAKVTESSQAVADQIMEMIGHLQFQDIVRQRLEQVITTLKHRSSFQGELIHSVTDPSAKTDHLYFDVDRIMRDYVMARQRMTHLSTLGQEEGKTESAASDGIILF